MLLKDKLQTKMLLSLIGQVITHLTIEGSECHHREDVR